MSQAHTVWSQYQQSPGDGVLHPRPSSPLHQRAKHSHSQPVVTLEWAITLIPNLLLMSCQKDQATCWSSCSMAKALKTFSQHLPDGYYGNYGLWLLVNGKYADLLNCDVVCHYWLCSSPSLACRWCLVFLKLCSLIHLYWSFTLLNFNHVTLVKRFHRNIKENIQSDYSLLSGHWLVYTASI